MPVEPGDTASASAGPIRIAAALIDDDAGRLLLVRKAGTPWFMQAGGKIEPGETAIASLLRELREEIGWTVCPDEVRPIGYAAAPAANEPGRQVDAALFHIRVRREPVAPDRNASARVGAPDNRDGVDRPILVSAEIAEAIWVDRAAAAALPLAPLTHDHILPLALSLPLAAALP